MAIWNEAKHARFRGKFASMGITRGELQDKFHLRSGDMVGGHAVVKHKEKGTLGVVSQAMRGSGFHALSVKPDGSLSKDTLTKKAFDTRGEAMAALAEHHGVLNEQAAKPKEAAKPKPKVKVKTGDAGPPALARLFGGSGRAVRQPMAASQREAQRRRDRENKRIAGANLRMNQKPGGPRGEARKAYEDQWVKDRQASIKRVSKKVARDPRFVKYSTMDGLRARTEFGRLKQGGEMGFESPQRFADTPNSVLSKEFSSDELHRIADSLYDDGHTNRIRGLATGPHPVLGPAGLKPGDEVVHPKYGRGVVSGYGHTGSKVMVHFMHEEGHNLAGGKGGFGERIDPKELTKATPKRRR